MKSGHRIRVLMLGWEYPPRFAGGLGKASRGLSLAMARQGAQVFFVLPSFPERIVEPSLEVVGAKEYLVQSGWTEEMWMAKEAEIASPTYTGYGALNWIRTQAQLFPYGAHPSGPVPEGVTKNLLSEPEGGSHSVRVDRTLTKTVRTGVRTTVKAFEEARKTLSDEKPSAAVTPTYTNSINGSVQNDLYGRNLWSEIERYCFAVRQLAEVQEVDVIHAHDWMTFPAAFEYQRVSGAPVFLHVHATEYDRSGENVNNDVFRIEREGFRKATHIFAVSRYTAGIIERLYGVQRKKISVVYNAPDEQAKSLLNSPDSPREPNVIFLGRLTFQKGPDHFLKAAALVSQVEKRARFIFCGTGDMFDKLRNMAHRLGIEDRVHFAGFVDPAGVDEILLKSRVLVMPSVSEPFGLVALEAIHCGIPVILSKQSGVREVLHRALQVDFWDHEKLADQVLAALRLPALSRQLVREGMEQVQQLSWDKSASKVLDTYRHYLGSIYAQAVGAAHGR